MAQGGDNNTVDADSVQQLMLEVEIHKNNVEVQKQEILMLNSKLNDEQHKNYKNENLLQLRCDYINTLQEADDINKARIVLQFKEVESLREKVSKLKQFKAATQEELNNLFNTLKLQESQIASLEHELRAKDEKIFKYKTKLESFEAETH
jgi:chromosome segregation ATPase